MISPKICWNLKEHRYHLYAFKIAPDISKCSYQLRWPKGTRLTFSSIFHCTSAGATSEIPRKNLKTILSV